MWIIDVALCTILVWVAIEDLRRFRIPNVAILLLVGCFLLACLAQGREGLLLPHLAFGAAALALLFGAFVLGMIGGGDAKLLAVALLWVGPEGAFVFAVSLLILVVVYAAGSRVGLLPARRHGRRTMIPYGPSIAGAWIVVMALVALL